MEPDLIPPEGNLFVWYRQHPEEIEKALRRLDQLSRLQIAVIQDGVTTNYPVQFAGDNALVEIRIATP